MATPTEVEAEPGAHPRKAWTRADLARVGGPALAGLGLLILFHALGRTYLGGYEPMLGSFELPEPREAMLWLSTAIYGVPIAVAFAVAATRAATLSPTARSALELLPSTDDKAWIAFGALSAMIIPVAIRALVLDDAPLADDESAYQFGAELIASGHLTAASPPMKLFYDRAFMINDGHLYPMYFMGWPILMAPGVWLGVPGYMNALYSGLTVPAIYLAAQELGGRKVARAAVLLFITAPMFAIAAATQMSNTTCLMTLSWTFACWLRSRRDGASLAWHAGIGAFFGLATLIRPASALGIGIPILFAWLVDALRGPRIALPRRLLAVGLPGAFALALFLAINKVQNGSYTHLSYDREFEYARENGFRFSIWGLKTFRAKMAAGNFKAHFSARPFFDSVANVSGAILRLGTATFGWVPSFLFALFGVRLKRAPELVLVLGVVGHFAVHFNVADLGVDLFGTHHYFEIALAMIFSTALGAQSIARWLADRAPSAGGSPPMLLPGALLAGLTVFAASSTTPPRLGALADMAKDSTFARDVLAREGVKRAVVFSPHPFTSRMARCTTGARHTVYWRPNNDPALKNPVLWVNHVTVEEDRKLMADFPDRTGVVLFFDESCVARFVPLTSPQANMIPRGNIDGTDPTPGTAALQRSKRSGVAPRSDE